MNFNFSILLALLIASSLETVTASCNADNCLRGLQHASATASIFCANYGGQSTALPTWASGCSSLPSRISSACACIITGTASTTAQVSTSTSAISNSSPTSQSSTSGSTSSLTSATCPSPTIEWSTVTSILSCTSSHVECTTRIME
jgi:pectinesterase